MALRLVYGREHIWFHSSDYQDCQEHLPPESCCEFIPKIFTAGCRSRINLVIFLARIVEGREGRRPEGPKGVRSGIRLQKECGRESGSTRSRAPHLAQRVLFEKTHVTVFRATARSKSLLALVLFLLPQGCDASHGLASVLYGSLQFCCAVQTKRLVEV